MFENVHIYDMPQHLDDGSENPEWLQARAGVFTASDFHQYLTGYRGKADKDGNIVRKLSDTAQKNLIKKAFEIVTGKPKATGFKSAAMTRGNELEDEARQSYELETFQTVEQCGFLKHKTLNLGGSLDGYVGKVCKILEIKNPEEPKFYDVLDNLDKATAISPEYRTQIQIQLFLSGAASCDFLNHYPEFKDLIINVKPDDEYIYEILQALDWVQPQLDKIVEKLRKLKK